MAPSKKTDDIAKLSFEEAIKDLTGIVGAIEEGQVSLQDSLEQYEKGMSLIKHCRGILQTAERRIEDISQASEAAGAAADGEANGPANDAPTSTDGPGLYD